MVQEFAPHEMLDLHEFLRTETLTATKIQAMLPMTADGDLTNLMQGILENKLARIQRIREFAVPMTH